jgi:hypothetical protein
MRAKKAIAPKTVKAVMDPKSFCPSHAVSVSASFGINFTASLTKYAMYEDGSQTFGYGSKKYFMGVSRTLGFHAQLSS